MPVRSLRVRASAELLDGLSSCLFDAGATGLCEDEHGLTAYAENDEELDALCRAIELFRQRIVSLDLDGQVGSPVVTAVFDDWDGAWLRELQPMPLAECWVLRPTHQGPAPSGENTLWFEPTRSFGSGEHPTTRLAAAELASLAKRQAGLRLFDVGAGNGVLSLVAVSAGFSSALAVDVDHEAVDATRGNAELNGLKDRIVSKAGSADTTDERFPVVVANISTPVLSELAPDLRARLTASGTLLLTGFLTEDVPALLELFSKLGLQLESRAEAGDWSLLVLRCSARNTASAATPSG